MKFFLSFFVFLVVVMVWLEPREAIAQTRYATCDACGFCVVGQDKATWSSVKVPDAWLACVACLYPGVSVSDSSSAYEGKTLEINPETNLPIAVQKGAYYSQLGCLSSDIGNFQNSGAAGSVVSRLLQIIFGFSGAIAFVYFIYGTFVLATSQANPDKIDYGRQVILGAIVGLIFSLGSVFVVGLLASGVLNIPGFGSASATP